LSSAHDTLLPFIKTLCVFHHHRLLVRPEQHPLNEFCGVLQVQERQR
jgi:hypothetical protein